MWYQRRQRPNTRITEICNGTFGKTITRIAWKENEVLTDSKALNVYEGGGEGRGLEKARILICIGCDISCSTAAFGKILKESYELRRRLIREQKVKGMKCEASQC